MLDAVRTSLIRTIAAKHIIGPGLDEALRACTWARNKGYLVTLSQWAQPGEHAASMAQQYLLAMTAVKRMGPGTAVSLKLDAIHFDEGLFSDLAVIANVYHLRLHIDSLGPETADRSWHVLERTIVRNNNVGMTLPSRWRRSLHDAERALELGIPIRIVKGQWIDPNCPRIDPRDSFLAIAGKLIGARGTVGIATHDMPLAKDALNVLMESRTPCELEQFLTLPLNGIALANHFGCGYRIYAAYGQPGIPYNVRFSFQRPSLALWMAADVLFPQKRPWLFEEIHT